MLLKQFCLRCYSRAGRNWDQHRDKWWDSGHSQFNFPFVLCPPWNNKMSVIKKIRDVRNGPPIFCTYHLKHKFYETKT